VAGASLAALAEAVVAFPVVRGVLLQVIPGASGPLANLPLFVAVFVGATALATECRRFPAMPAVAAAAGVALGIVQTREWGPATGPGPDVVAVIVALVLAFRVVTLALRDWREPVDTTLLVGSLMLLAEILLSGGVSHGWPSAVTVAIPVFFTAVLASRACSLWLAAPDATASADRRRIVVDLLIGYAAAIVVALLIGGKGGPVRIVGAILFPAGAGVVSVLTLLLAQLLRPVFWLASRIHIDPAALQRALQRLRNSAASRTHVPSGGAAHFGTVERLLGLALLVAVALLLVRAIRRRHGSPDETRAHADADDDVRVAPLPPQTSWWARGSSARRHELPADTVRRWYAELLLSLRDLGLIKPNEQTPAEFLTAASAAYPECRDEMEELTRAYEGVRYGNATLSPSALAALRATRDRAAAALHRASPILPTETGGAGTDPGSSPG
jgi:hypothetical protein